MQFEANVDRTPAIAFRSGMRSDPHREVVLTLSHYVSAGTRLPRKTQAPDLAFAPFDFFRRVPIKHTEHDMLRY